MKSKVKNMANNMLWHKVKLEFHNLHELQYVIESMENELLEKLGKVDASLPDVFECETFVEELYDSLCEAFENARLLAIKIEEAKHTFKLRAKSEAVAGTEQDDDPWEC